MAVRKTLSFVWKMRQYGSNIDNTENVFSIQLNEIFWQDIFTQDWKITVVSHSTIFSLEASFCLLLPWQPLYGCWFFNDWVTHWFIYCRWQPRVINCLWDNPALHRPLTALVTFHLGLLNAKYKKKVHNCLLIFLVSCIHLNNLWHLHVCVKEEMRDFLPLTHTHVC